ncbi:MAG TPA: hypothetical protein VKA64_05810 [Gammaproteobacteria bacterium]|nr:hypothetical protein [Gammaproteobacteria bacterium]
MTATLGQIVLAAVGFIGAAALLLGVTLLLRPGLVWRFCAVLDRWWSGDALVQWLNTPRAVERLLYRYHRPFGALLILGSTYTLYAQAFRFRPEEASTALASAVPGPLVEPFVDAMALALFFGNLFAFAVGVVVSLRPSLLKGLEGWSNRWLTLDSLLRALDRPYWEVDRIIHRHPRASGATLVLAGLYLLLVTVAYSEVYLR